MGKGKFSGVWVYLERSDKALQDVSLEILGKAVDIAKKLGEEVTGILLGDGVKDLAYQAIAYGADNVLVVDSPVLSSFSAGAYSYAVEQLVRRHNPDILLIGATHDGVDLAGRLAVKLSTGLMAHVVELEVEEGTGALLGSVPSFGGGILAVCKCERKPQMATVKQGVFSPLKPDKSRKGTVEIVEVEIPEVLVGSKVVKSEKVLGEDITRAEVVVVAGNGTKGDLSLPKKLADVLGGKLGVTRPLADAGFASHDVMIGSTGCSVSPKLAIVVGASGASHFLSGIVRSETIVSINTDPNASIFDYSDYCIVGDLFEILPKLIAKVEEVKRG